MRAPSEKREVEADANVIRGEVLLAGVQLCRVRVGEDNWFLEANAWFKDHVEEQLRRREIVSARFSQFWTLMSFRWSLVKSFEPPNVDLYPKTPPSVHDGGFFSEVAEVAELWSIESRGTGVREIVQ